MEKWPGAIIVIISNYSRSHTHTLIALILFRDDVDDDVMRVK